MGRKLFGGVCARANPWPSARNAATA